MSGYVYRVNVRNKRTQVLLIAGVYKYRRQAAVEIKFCTLAPNMCGLSVHIFLLMSSFFCLKLWGTF